MLNNIGGGQKFMGIREVLLQKLTSLHKKYLLFLEGRVKPADDLVKVYSHERNWKKPEYRLRAKRLLAVQEFVDANERALKPYFQAWESWKFTCVERTVFDCPDFEMECFNFRITDLPAWQGVLRKSLQIQGFIRRMEADSR
jgi:hypothetical protein